MEVNIMWISLLVAVCCFLYIAYHREYYKTKLIHSNYKYYPLFKPIHYVINIIYFKYYGKHSNFIHTKSQTYTRIQNHKLNEQYASKSIEYVRIVCISDSHELHRQLHIPNGDILIHCGDILFANSHKYSESKSIQKLIDFNEWLGSLPHCHKIVIAGNHDYCLEKIGYEKSKQILSNCIYLINEKLDLNFNGNKKIKFFCSPYSIPNSTFSPNTAFQYEREDIGDKVWSKIPADIDILVTHHMVKGFLCNGKGCERLLEVIQNKCVKVKYSLYGHWHATYGVKFGNGKQFRNEYRNNICFINASVVDNLTCAIQPAVVFDYYFD
eukprot:126643_1